MSQIPILDQSLGIVARVTVQANFDKCHWQTKAHSQIIEPRFARGMADDDEAALIGFAGAIGRIAVLLSPDSLVLRWRPREY